MSPRRTVITGLGTVCPLGLTVADAWKNAVEGRSGIRAIDAFDTSEYSSRIGGQVWGFEPTDFMEKRLSRRLDRYAQLAVAAGTQATTDAGLDLPGDTPERIGVTIGTGIGGIAEVEAQHSRLLEVGPSRVSPLLVPKLMSNAAAGQLSILLGVKGPNFAVATACASAAHAVASALRIIQRGEADVMIAGGSEAALTSIGLSGFCALKALSTRNDDPTRASRPFDRDRDGFVLAEGAGVIVLEELERAKARGAKIYAELLGCGMNADAFHITEPDPAGAGACMASALGEAGIAPDEVIYVNAHGTSTIAGDVAETKAVKAALGDAAQSVMISSTKSVSGHLLGGAAGLELVLTTKAVVEGIIPPTINLEDPDPACDLDYVPNEAREIDVKIAVSNSFGFGGHNASLVIRGFE